MERMKQVQAANLKIIKEVDRICRKHGIHYLLDAGTLIGAIRHKGFIPWDDDVDFAFLREEYEKFIRVVKDELQEGIHLWTPSDSAGYEAFFDFTPKLVYENSRKKLPDADTAYYKEEMNHICADIFILDEISEKPLARSWQILLNKIIYGMAMGHRRKLDFSKYSFLQKLQVALLAAIGSTVNMELLCKWERRAALRQTKGKSRLLYYSNYEPGYVHMTVPREGSEQVLEVPFEDMQVMIPKGYDTVLRTVYGDYMTLPPEENRKPKHGEVDTEGFYVDGESGC